MTALFDLHLHSYWSYDACAPIEYYFQQAAALGLKTIAITEHHTMDSIREIAAIAVDYPEINYIPAAELTVNTSIGAVDLVCLGLPVEAPPALEKMFGEYRQWQCDTGDAYSRAMTAMNYPYGREERLELISQYRPERVIAKQGITHVSGSVQRREFIRRGWTTQEQISDFMQKVGELAQAPKYPAASRVIPEVKKHGGLVFIAHPKNYFRMNDLNRMNTLCEELSLDGIECAHTSTPPELTVFYRNFCVERGLLSSAGSDCHSDPPHYHLGISLQNHFAEHCGDIRWLEEIQERLK